MSAVERVYADAGATSHLRTERFGPAPHVRRPAVPTSGARLDLARTQRTLDGDTAHTLLEQLESAGERPAYGCRRGICHSCRCLKLSGVVENLLTGETSGPGRELIQACISVPRGDVALDL